jgi:hypothetical protein
MRKRYNMDELECKRIQEIIKDYIKDHLNISIERDSYEGIVKVELHLDEENISSGYFPLKEHS